MQARRRRNVGPRERPAGMRRNRFACRVPLARTFADVARHHPDRRHR
ncbi:hypothetical protein BUC_6745 [Burkholderia pseudomallei 576]|nr:hypothetical protein BUC_6745 [Burkholderia pseudomallei 576]